MVFTLESLVSLRVFPYNTVTCSSEIEGKTQSIVSQVFYWVLPWLTTCSMEYLCKVAMTTCTTS